MKNHIPHALIYTRLVIGISFIMLAFIKPDNISIILGTLLIIGILTDVFDGIIARALKISTPDLRLLDTKVDRIFWFCALFCLGMNFPNFILDNLKQISILISLEFTASLVGYIRFNQGISFHTILSKFWALNILSMFIAVLINGEGGIAFKICFIHGLIAQSEIILVALLLPKYQNDIPSCWHAIQIRKGKTIKRLKLFNG